MFLRLNKYHICDCGAVCDTGSFLHRGFFKLSFVDGYTIFIFYSIFCIHAAALIILLMLFGHPIHGVTNVSL